MTTPPRLAPPARPLGNSEPWPVPPHRHRRHGAAGRAARRRGGAPARRSVPPFVRLVQLLGAVAVGLFFGITVGAIAAAGRPVIAAATPEPTPTRTVSAPAQPLANTLSTGSAGPLSLLGPGTYEVGTGNGEALPGKYRSIGPDGGYDACYYARLRNNDGSPADILSNNITSGPSIFTLAPGDGYVQISGCTFTKV